MATTIIGVDPHKHSHTAVVLDDNETIAARLRVTADRRQIDELLAWSRSWPDRLWAIENAHGLGHLLTQQLLGRGEQVVDVPATLSTRTRKLSGHSGRKTDEHDARSVAIVAAGRQLRQVAAEDDSAVLGLLVDRRWHLVSGQHKTIVRLHALLCDLVPGGVRGRLSRTRAAGVLRSIRPSSRVDVERKRVAHELLEDWRWTATRIPAVEDRIREALDTTGCTLTTIYGIADVSAATILAIVGDVHRFPTRGHFAAFSGTAPIEASSGDRVRHRLSRRGNRQLNKLIHTAAVTQISHGALGRAHYQRKLAEGKSAAEARRSLKRHLSDVIYRQLLTDARRRQAARGGQQETRPKSA